MLLYNSYIYVLFSRLNKTHLLYFEAKVEKGKNSAKYFLIGKLHIFGEKNESFCFLQKILWKKIQR